MITRSIDRSLCAPLMLVAVALAIARAADAQVTRVEITARLPDPREQPGPAGFRLRREVRESGVLPTNAESSPENQGIARRVCQAR